MDRYLRIRIRGRMDGSGIVMTSAQTEHEMTLAALHRRPVERSTHGHKLRSLEKCEQFPLDTEPGAGL